MQSQPAAARGSRFFANSAIIIAVLIVLSFPLTYFIPLTTGTKQFSLLRHLHGLVFFTWTVLIAVQPWLVRSGRIKLHREVGLLGAALAGAMVPLGLWLATVAIADRIGQKFALPFEFALYNLVDITLFALTIGWAIHQATRRIEWHRRLVFVSMLMLLGPAWSRLWYEFASLPWPWIDLAPNVSADLLLFVLAWHDRRELGRIHPVTLGAIALLIPFHTVEPLIARSGWWNAVAPALFGFG
jgi:hypothetical protein